MNSPEFYWKKVNPTKTMMVTKTIEKQYYIVIIIHVTYCFFIKVYILLFFPMNKNVHLESIIIRH